MDSCQSNIVDSPVKGTIQLEDKVKEAAPKTTSLAQFAAAQKASSWECPACFTRNDNSRITCLACEAPKPGHEEEVKKMKEAKEASKPVMTIGAGGGFKFGSSGTVLKRIFILGRIEYRILFV